MLIKSETFAGCRKLEDELREKLFSETNALDLIWLWPKQ